MKERILYWIPRILSIGAVLFMMMFSLDCFDEYTKWQQVLVCLIMHNIPSFLILLCVIICWYMEFVGGIILIILSIAASFFFRAFAGNPWSLIVTMPFLLIGVLFIIHHRLYGKKGTPITEVQEQDQ